MLVRQIDPSKVGQGKAQVHLQPVSINYKNQAAPHGALNAAVEGTEGDPEVNPSRSTGLMLRHAQEIDRWAQSHTELYLVALATPSHLTKIKLAIFLRFNQGS